MAVTRDGIPVRCWTSPGNTADQKIIRKVKDDLGGWNLCTGWCGSPTAAAPVRRQPESVTLKQGRWALHPCRRGRLRDAGADGGPLQLSLFDQQDLAEITSDDFPGERLVARRNPVLAAERARKREDLLAATEKLLAPIIARVQAHLAGSPAPGRSGSRSAR